MTTKVKGIVIGGTNIKEKDKLIKVFTLEKGKMFLSMRGVRGERAKLKTAKEIFCFGEFIVEEGKVLNVVTGVDVIDNFFEISQNIDRYYEGCAILDIIDKTTNEESNSQLFIELIRCLKTLCYDNVRKYYCVDKFLIFVFENMGYSFFNEKCSGCGAVMGIKYFDLQVGEFLCPNCKTYNSIVVSDSAFSALRLLKNIDYEKLPTLKLGGMGEVQAFNLLCKNFEFRIGSQVLNM